jgi:para-aminobenzoate synthetase component 1
MKTLLQECATSHTPESLAEQLRGLPGLVLLRTGLFNDPLARYSFVSAAPFLTFRSFGSRCETSSAGTARLQFGNPWHVLDALLARYEVLDQADLPFPLGGCFGYWGYDLKHFVEPRLPHQALNDLELPDCHVGFYDSLVVFDHRLDKAWIVSTGLQADGSRQEKAAGQKLGWWQEHLVRTPQTSAESVEKGRGHLSLPLSSKGGEADEPRAPGYIEDSLSETGFGTARAHSTFSREGFIRAVEKAQAYIRSGDIYQVNLSQRLSQPWSASGWALYQALAAASPAPFSAYLDAGDFTLASSSPEEFLRLSGHHIQTRPIKGTRPRDPDPTRDAQLAYELQTSPKELAELIMITDLLRNDLGRICEFGSVQTPTLAQLERYPQVQHLVSTVEGRLRPEVTHLAALASCFPGGSITGAPKFRAMEIIEELEPVTRGPYTGALGYLGFNRESQLSIIIRTALCKDGLAHFPVGAGIVADSVPAAEYEETLDKARGFFEAVERGTPEFAVTKANRPRMTKETAESRAIGDPNHPAFDGVEFLKGLKK